MTFVEILSLSYIPIATGKESSINFSGLCLSIDSHLPKEGLTAAANQPQTTASLGLFLHSTESSRGAILA